MPHPRRLPAPCTPAEPAACLLQAVLFRKYVAYAREHVQPLLSPDARVVSGAVMMTTAVRLRLLALLIVGADAIISPSAAAAAVRQAQAKS